YPARSAIALTLFREGQKLPLAVTAVEFPASLAETLSWDRLGLELAAARGGLAVSRVRPGSPAARAGLAPGDRILRVNDRDVATPSAWRDALVEARSSRSVLLLVQRGRIVANLSLPFQKG